MMAVVLAGGKGTRLMPYTAVFPKPLMPLGDMPVIEILLRQLARAGVTKVILAVNHLHHLIRAFCGNGSSFGLEIEYCLEDKPMGTAGPLTLVRDRLAEEFIVANGDLLTDFNMAAMIERHKKRNSGASMAVVQRQISIEFGLIETDEDMQLIGYREKPVWPHLVSMGLYMFSRDAVAPYLGNKSYLDMPELMRSLAADGVGVDCIRQDCSWLDIGQPADYAKAQTLFSDSREMYLGPV